MRTGIIQYYADGQTIYEVVTASGQKFAGTLSMEQNSDTVASVEHSDSANKKHAIPADTKVYIDCDKIETLRVKIKKT